MGLFQELRRRKIFRVAAIYGVTGWLLAQAATIAFGAFKVPEWALQAFIIVIVLGFPVALVLAYAFEVTPDGMVRRTEAVEGAETTILLPGKSRLDYAILALFAVAIGWLIYRTEVAPSDSPVVAEQAESSGVLHNSIAVLPFDNLSPDPDNAYFAAGMHEEILNQLAKIEDLTVIARTSVLQYAGAKRPMSEIASELNVGAVMEGSVRYAGTRVRITAQLIDAENGAHLWSEAYDRDLKDIFAIQSDIALKITEAMKAEFSIEERQAIATALTDNPEAYAHYVRAMSRISQPIPDQPAIQGDLDRAIELDPDFAAALAFRAFSHAIAISFISEDMLITPESQARNIAQATAYADRALAVDPNQARAYIARAFVDAAGWRWASSFANSERAYQLNPNQAHVIFDYAFRLSYQRGKVDEGLALMDRAIALDPQAIHLPLFTAFVMFDVGRYDEAMRYSRQVMAMAPDSYLPYLQLALAAAYSDDGNLALEMAKEAEARMHGGTPAYYRISLLRVYDRLGRTEDTARTLSTLYELDKTRPLNDSDLARINAITGDLDKAFDHLNTMIDNNFPTFPIQFLVLLPNHPMWEGLRDDPRFEEARRKVGLPE